MWESSCRVDLIENYASWASEQHPAGAACDAIRCCPEHAVSGSGTVWSPVSEKHPLNKAKRHVAGVPMGQSITLDTTSLEDFCSARGAALLDTVVDGDCGFDTMCIMLGLPQTLEQRSKVPEEIHEYIIQRVQEPRLHDLLVASCEISADDAEAYAQSTTGQESGGNGFGVVAEQNAPALAGKSSATLEIMENFGDH